MTGAEPRGNVIYLQEVRGNAQRSSARRPPRRTSPRPLHRKAVRRLTVSAVIAVLTIAGLLALLMPQSGTEEKPPSAAGQADALPAPLPTLVMVEEDKPEYIPDTAEVEALAKMLYGEARGIASDTEKAACVWCVLNRVDNPRLIYCTNLLADRCGGTDTRRCIWFFPTWPAIISTSFAVHTIRISSRVLLAIFPTAIGTVIRPILLPRPTMSEAIMSSVALNIHRNTSGKPMHSTVPTAIRHRA